MPELQLDRKMPQRPRSHLSPKKSGLKILSKALKAVGLTPRNVPASPIPTVLKDHDLSCHHQECSFTVY